MKRFTVNFNGIPRECEDLIVQFAYNCTSIDMLNDMAMCSFMNSNQLPVPLSWKRLLVINGPDREFSWKEFLKQGQNPYILQTLISLRSVRGTVERLNWLFLKTYRCLSVSYLIDNYTKKKLLQMLTRWTTSTVTILFLIQRLLCSIEIPRALNSQAKKYFNYQQFLILNPNPLSMYIHAPKRDFS